MKTSLVLLSICTDELISTPTIITFLPTLPSGNRNSKRKSNPITYPLYAYLSRSAFLTNVTPLNKQSFIVKLEFKCRDHVSNS